MRTNREVRKRGSRLMEGETLPGDIEIALATLVPRPPTSDDYLNEIKWDGYRALAWLRTDGVRLISRNRRDATASAPSVVAELGRLGVTDTVLDGELVALNGEGRSDFGLLQRTLGTRTVQYVVFDLLRLDGRDVRVEPLRTRKVLLDELFATQRLGHVRVCEHVKGNAQAVYEAACKLGLEGILSKRAEAPYPAGRTSDWQKSKCPRAGEFPIVGFRTPEGLRNVLSSLLLAEKDSEGHLRYVGRVGTGFSDRMLREFYALLSVDELPNPPVRNVPRGVEARRVRWVKPRYVAKITFTELTHGGTLRHPVFRGLRKAAGEL